MGGSEVPKVKVIPVGSGAGNAGSASRLWDAGLPRWGMRCKLGELEEIKGDLGGAQSCAPKIRPRAAKAAWNRSNLRFSSLRTFLCPEAGQVLSLCPACLFFLAFIPADPMIFLWL